jgi:hypothetical protein
MAKPSRNKAYGLNVPLIDVFPFPLYETRVPTTADKSFDVGQLWIYRNGDARQVYIFGGIDSSNLAIWALSSTNTGDLATLEGDTGGAIVPTLENIIIAGGSNISTEGSSSPGTITINLATNINVTSAQLGLINVATNYITSTTSNTNIRLEPNGTGKVTIEYATQHAVPVYGASGALNEVGPLTNGQLLIGSTGATPVAASLTSTGGSVTITQGAGSINLEAVGGAGLTWSVVTAATATLAAGEGIFCNRGAGVTVSLPTSAAVGDTYQVYAMNAGGFVINYGTGQSIRIGTTVTTVTSGTLSSVNIGDFVEIICNVADTGFIASVKQGNLTST